VFSQKGIALNRTYTVLGTRDMMVWEKIVIEMDAINLKGKMCHLVNVPAQQNTKTGTIGVSPFDVTKALIDQGFDPPEGNSS
jgi:hypothetical protein